MFTPGVNISEYQRGSDIKAKRRLIERYNGPEGEILSQESSRQAQVQGGGYRINNDLRLGAKRDEEGGDYRMTLMFLIWLLVSSWHFFFFFYLNKKYNEIKVWKEIMSSVFDLLKLMCLQDIHEKIPDISYI